MKYKFLFLDYLNSVNFTITLRIELKIEFDQYEKGDQIGRYAILDEWQAIQVKFIDPNIPLIPLEE